MAWFKRMYSVRHQKSVGQNRSTSLCFLFRNFVLNAFNPAASLIPGVADFTANSPNMNIGSIFNFI